MKKLRATLADVSSQITISDPASQFLVLLNLSQIYALILFLQNLMEMSESCAHLLE